MATTTKCTLTTALFAYAITVSGIVSADAIPPGWQALNMEPIGFLDYHDRYSGKLTIKESDGKWYLYQAYNKTTDGKPPAIVVTDVTDLHG